MFKFVKKDPPYKVSQNVLTTSAQGLDNLYQGIAIGDTMVFGSNAVHNVRVTYNRTRVQRSTEKWFSPYDIGSNVYTYNPGEMSFTVQNAFAIGGVNSGIFNTDSYQVSDDLTLVRGNHQLAFGANVAYLTMDFLTNARVGGTWTVNGQNTGLSLADFLLGRVSTLEHGAGNLLPTAMWYQGVYAQDTWRAGSRVTINAGLRWEPFFGQNVTNGAIYNWDRDNFRNNVTSKVFLRAPAGLLYPGDEGFPPGKTGLNKQWLNFSPRFGLAWDVHGDGRTAVRTSYGIGYDFPTAERHNINAGAPPWGNRSLLQDPPGGLDDPYSYVGGDPHPIATTANTEFVTFGAFGATDPDIKSPRTHTRNDTLEPQLGSPVDPDPAESGCLPGDRAVHHQGCGVSGMQHDTEPQPAACAHALRRKPGVGGADREHGSPHEHRQPGLPRFEALCPPQSGGRNLAQRQLHLVAMLRR
jgi:hypothetical protein